MEKPSLDKTKAGAIRYNTDISQLEIYDGNQWEAILGTSPELQTGGTRGIGMGGYNGSSLVDNIDFVNIDSTGNATDFGNIQATNYEAAGIGSRVRAFAGGGAPQNTRIEFVTFASQGNATQFGTLSAGQAQLYGLSNATRGIFAGGSPYPNGTNSISYITMSHEGNAVDFGDISRNKISNTSCASPTR